MYSIKDLETLSGIKAHTIRIWEKRYNLLEPQRTGTNIRKYCDDDLRKILNVAMLVKHGFRISKVSEWCNERIAEEILSLDDSSKKQSDFIERLLVSTVNFDEDQINATLENAIGEVGLEKAITKIVFPFFEQVGLYWQVGSLFPAQEHYFSNLLRQKIIAETDRLSVKTKRKETILFYLHEDERHELSLLFFNMVALSLGFRTIYLGQNVPLEDLKGLQVKKKADMVFTVFINSIEKEELENYLKKIAEIYPGKRVFISGGQIALHNPELPQKFNIVTSVKKFKRYLGV
ncbi:MAG: MerR family transcriptional regulator [Prolixibacteraceae bacterium]|nr:MerR family transcriptional regulator [Prolixibacteraceae bacterium]